MLGDDNSTNLSLTITIAARLFGVNQLPQVGLEPSSTLKGLG
jgi:hypothetical protein